MSTALSSRPIDATLTVTKAARVLGVHPNTVRAWSDAGRLRYYRINPRGDRRYRLGDLHRFMAAAESGLADPASVPAGLGAVGRRGGLAATLAAGVPARRHDPADRTTGAHEAGRDALDFSIIEAVARQARDHADLDEHLTRTVARLRDTYDHHLVAIWERRGERLFPRAVARSTVGPAERLVDRPRTFGVLGAAAAHLEAGERGVATSDPERGAEPLPVLAGGGHELAVVIPGEREAWGVLHVVADRSAPFEVRDVEVAAILADQLAGFVEAARRREAEARQLHRAEALYRVAGDIGSRLDLDRILSGLVDHAMVLFEADRGAVFLRRQDGSVTAEVSRGLSANYLGAVRDFPTRSLPARSVAARRPMFAVAYAEDPRADDERAAVIQEGFDTICTAPLLDGTDVLGHLNVYHDRASPWTEDDLETVTALAAQASVAIRAAQDYERMATWAAQLQSIQQLGSRLDKLSSVREIGLAIASELRQLIDCHNVRVYRLIGTELLPVAMQGQVGEYVDQTSDQLRVSVGEGITGWVAQHGIPQRLPDAAADPRGSVIPGTEPELPESMLLAPMTYDDAVIGVLVLSKIGLDQFTDDDLRLLVIYASFAAQAMANADTTERLRDQSAALERQVRGQRALLDISESILSTLDGRTILESITERLGGLIHCDNIAIEVLDPSTGLLTPLTARGIDAEDYMLPWEPGETGVATWVVEHNEPAYVPDERSDPRVNHFKPGEIQDGCLIVIPLRGRDGAIGVLTLERLGRDVAFSPDEFDLVQLFAAQVSIALQNAEVFRAVEIRAQTDDLTGLLNHGTFEERLERAVTGGSLFSLIMLDLDDFRDVNNTLGHQAGDRHLRAIADALGRAGRETDQLFRYGGDEFSILLPGTDAPGAMLVAGRVAAAIRGVGAGISASIGVATYPADGEDAKSVLLAADRACFVAKRQGRDRIATAAQGLALAAEFSEKTPTPIDPTGPAAT